MLTFEDCLAFAELTEEEVDAIAEHEHLPETVALELGAYLARSAEGQRRIELMIVEDIQVAQRRGDRLHAAKLKHVLRRFCLEHQDRRR
jgi:hypothetical protein